MGEAKRRQKLDPNFGKSPRIDIPVKSAMQFIRKAVSSSIQLNRGGSLCVLTNDERGYRLEVIEAVRKHLEDKIFEIPTQIFMLPEGIPFNPNSSDPFEGLVCVFSQRGNQELKSIQSGSMSKSAPCREITTIRL
jgi:hypothetical protein